MQKDTYIKSLFKVGIRSLHENANDDIVEMLHDELLLKVFRAEIAPDVKDYQDSKLEIHNFHSSLSSWYTRASLPHSTLL
jgi:hypothetical protein